MHIATNGVKLAVRDQGNGPVAIVYLHYWGGSSRTWQPVIAAMPEGCRHVALDLRGWGDSDKPDGDVALADLACDVAGVVDALGLERYVLVGHSMGGKVAQLLAGGRPRGLCGLALVAPAPPLPLQLTDEQRGAMRMAYRDEHTVAATLDAALTAHPLPAPLRRQVIEDSLRGSLAARDAWLDEGVRADIAQAARNIDVPVLVLSGEHDRVDPPAALRAHLLPVIPQARLQIVPGCGHLLPLEAPQAVAGAIDGFVRGLELAA